MSRTVIEESAGKIEPKTLSCVGDYVLIRMLRREKSVGGIHLPKSANQGTELAIGEVMDVGRSVPNTRSHHRIPIDDIKKGEYALTIQYMGEDMRIGGEDYKFVREHGVWATVEFKDLKTWDIKDVHPRFNSILIEPEKEETTESGNIYLPNEQNAQSGVRRATVVKIGPGGWHLPSLKRLPVEVSPGDQIIFQRYAGAFVKVGGVEYRLCQEQDVHMITEKA